ncbi:MAG TPA: copper resistance protein CopC [Gaiellaceae bacterium]
MRRAAVVFALALALPAQAFAHASLREAQPAFKQRLQTAPSQVRLHFDQGVKAFSNSIEVLTPDGRVVSGRARSGTSALDVVVPVRRLPAGGYTVRWHALSADSHTVSGVFTFGVRAAAPNVLEAYGASGPTRTEHVVRWIYFLSLALLSGGIAFRLLVVRGPLPPRAEKRFYVVAGLGVIGALEAGILAFLLRSEDALQLPFGKLLYGDLEPIVTGTRFGRAFVAMTLGFALVAAFLFLAWLTDRLWLLWPALLLGVGFASGLSLSGHSAVDAGSSWLSELADWVHLSAATIWIGGLVQLVVVVWPAAPELRRAALMRFSRVATVCVAAILAAGIYLSVLRLPHLHDLWTVGYGQVLLVKLGLVCVALMWGAAHQFLVLPALERGEPIRGRIGKSLLGESAVGMAILLAAAVLVDSKPPPRPAPGSPAQAAAVSR